VNAAPAWIKLRDFFAATYRSPAEIELVIDEAGFTRGEVTAHGRPIIVWHEIFRRGEAMGRIYVMTDRAKRRHPENLQLEEALRAYVQSLEEAVRTKKPEVRQLTIRLVQQLGQSIDRFNKLFGPIRPDAGWSAPRLDIATTELQSLLVRLEDDLQDTTRAVGACPRPLNLPEFIDKAEEALQLQQRFQGSLATLISPTSSRSARNSELRRFRPLGELLAAALEDLRHSMAEEILPPGKTTKSQVT
jgi:hypothetical protein